MMSLVSNIVNSVYDLQEEIATDVLASLSKRDIYGVVSNTGEFVTNPVPYSLALAQLKTKYDIFDPPERSPLYNIENVETKLIHTDQRLVKHEKVKNIVLNYTSITKPILVARFEEHPFLLVLNGNHRLSSAYLLKQKYISAYVLDIRVSFL
ncbi:ParB-like nuclease domain-containing protein [Rhizobium phage RHph_I46]|uniref:ParB-like nuclease domain-containing protein n=1 Tax=Rhizobium phage RHph_I1_9 TaxID=2509729 RepID=A0A7S5R9K8_9CAUD|nr:ParB-like partition protein [Rhizobium phage RHph_I1_9]QIG69766.1 ParB-like nuclease domain-containing protein [Rhizobium phage RHph_I46]QIG71047.1 ParB-like nuclease domain-containing protein [Rhizobium phage RHph_I9]QIG73632.1 ParB-like nuclease domain-containing protein [Rhizobium phage RHph_I1_9]QIG76386.1 ParB-like nuclease domain-containing protein [Rhizobium phage RHph_I34]